MGKNIVGRYWYAQLLLSEYCDVVAWVDDANSISKELEYDVVLVAK